MHVWRRISSSRDESSWRWWESASASAVERFYNYRKISWDDGIEQHRSPLADLFFASHNPSRHLPSFTSLLSFHSKMKFQATVIAASLCAIAATPAFGKPINRNAAGLQERQTLADTSNELQDGPCKEVFFIFARGSTEPGNMVRLWLTYISVVR